jgi:hypothetical protein
MTLYPETELPAGWFVVTSITYVWLPKGLSGASSPEAGGNDYHAFAYDDGFGLVGG